NDPRCWFPQIRMIALGSWRLDRRPQGRYHRSWPPASRLGIGWYVPTPAPQVAPRHDRNYLYLSSRDLDVPVEQRRQTVRRRFGADTDTESWPAAPQHQLNFDQGGTHKLYSTSLVHRQDLTAERLDPTFFPFHSGTHYP